MRLMYDCTRTNIAAVRSVIKPGNLIALYVTGSPDIQSTPADRASFPNNPLVTIDQGFTGSPVADANVRDVEPGAWTAGRAITLGNWIAPRKTIYCDRNDLNTVIADGWQGDVWLAEPGPMPTAPPHFTGVNVVAVQFGFHSQYDVSVVFDDNWPHLQPVTETLSATGHNGYANFGWSPDLNATFYELLVVGAGGEGTGTSWVDDKITVVTPGHQTHAMDVKLAPGWYIARVRAHENNGQFGKWSAGKKFLVTRVLTSRPRGCMMGSAGRL